MSLNAPRVVAGGRGPALRRRTPVPTARVSRRLLTPLAPHARARALPQSNHRLSSTQQSHPPLLQAVQVRLLLSRRLRRRRAQVTLRRVSAKLNQSISVAHPH